MKLLMVRLQILSGPNAGQLFDLPPGDYRVGSDAANGVQIEDESISPHHGEWKVGEDTLQLRDLGSIQGTCLRGELVETAEVHPGEQFRLGTVEFRCLAGNGPVRIGAARRPVPSSATVGASFAAAPRTEGPGSFWQGLREAFAFPLRGKGVALLLGGSVFFAIADFIRPFFLIGLVVGLIATAYLLAYLQSVVMTSAQGEPELPEWPDMANSWSDIFRPYLLWLAVLLLCLGPGMLLATGALNSLVSGGANTQRLAFLGFILLGIGAFYLPMALLGVSLADGLTGLNPFVLIPAIIVLIGPYCVTWLVLALALGAQWLIAAAIDRLPIPVLPALLGWLATLYLLLLMTRLLGLLYYTGRHRLRWFGER